MVIPPEVIRGISDRDSHYPVKVSSIGSNAIDHRHCVPRVNVRPNGPDGCRCLLFLPEPIHTGLASGADGREDHPDQGRRIMKLLHGRTVS